MYLLTYSLIPLLEFIVICYEDRDFVLFILVFLASRTVPYIADDNKYFLNKQII